MTSARSFGRLLALYLLFIYGNLSVVVSACDGSWPDGDGDGTPDCSDLCPIDALKSVPGTCGCGVADTDTDSDGTPDCSDLCPTDGGKSVPGVCGCGIPDTDTDGDGRADCIDQCPCMETYTCDNQLTTVSCAAGDSAVIIGASYGRESTEICPHINDGNTACALDVQYFHAPLCDDQNSCSFTSDDVYGTDPCVGIDKYLTLEYCCHDGTDSDSDGTVDCVDFCKDDATKVTPGICGCGVSDTADADADGTPDCTDLCPADPSKSTPLVCGCGVAEKKKKKKKKKNTTEL